MNPRSLQSGVQLSLSSIANAWGCARETAKRKLDAAGVGPAGERRGHAVYDLKDVVGAFRDTSSDPDRLRPFERKAFYQSEHEKLRLEVERGELMSRIEAEHAMARAFEIVGRFLDTFVDVLERTGLATPKQLERWETELDDMRERLYDALVEDFSAEPTATNPHTGS